MRLSMHMSLACAPRVDPRANRGICQGKQRDRLDSLSLGGENYFMFEGKRVGKLQIL